MKKYVVSSFLLAILAFFLIGTYAAADEHEKGQVRIELLAGDYVVASFSFGGGGWNFDGSPRSLTVRDVLPGQHNITFENYKDQIESLLGEPLWTAKLSFPVKAGYTTVVTCSGEDAIGYGFEKMKERVTLPLSH